MKKTLIISSVALGFLALAAGLVFAADNGIPQASITLQNSDAKYCYTHNNTWTLTKEVTGNTVDQRRRNSHVAHHRHQGSLGSSNLHGARSADYHQHRIRPSHYRQHRGKPAEAE